MTDPEFKFREKYRVPSNRLTGYDYSSEGAYFITICTKNRENYFGEIIERAMGLNEYGKIVKNEILDMENHFKDVTVDEFVVMPNHVHLILVLGNIDDSGDKTTDDDEPTHCRDAINRVSTGGDNHEGWITWKNNIMLQPFSIGNIIRRFKWKCTFLCRNLDHRDIHDYRDATHYRDAINRVSTGNILNGLFFSWQPNYHDHIIRDENELNRIRQYIVDNPLQWEYDENYRE